jgi:hypothetical protein
MSVKFFGESNTPMRWPANFLTANTTAKILTPSSDKKIVLTDMSVSAANAGTIRFYWHSGGDTTYSSSLMLEHYFSSAVVSLHFDTPRMNENINGILSVVPGATGPHFVNFGGFEV